MKIKMKGSKIMKKGFTLAEVLITLAIIGVVAALTIPSVILNTNQQEYKTGLKKAVSVLNQAISMNMALDNVSPQDVTGTQANLVNYFADRMNVLKSDPANGQFYTTDGMRFQILSNVSLTDLKKGDADITAANSSDIGCTAAKPCVMVVDVNGDRKPNTFAEQKNTLNTTAAKVEGDVINDLFYIKITGDSAMPLGNLASNTMFQ